MEMQKQYSMKDASSLTKWAKVFLYIGIAVGFLSLIATIIIENQDLRDMEIGYYIINAVQSIGYYISIYIILKWIHRMNNNLRAMGATDMKFTPGWAIGYFFIPVAQLWKPYQAMKEIWKASKNPAYWKTVKVPAVLPLWWTLWLILFPISFIANKLIESADTVSAGITAYNMLIISKVVEIAFCASFLYIISNISKMQAEVEQNLPSYNLNAS